MTHEFVQAKTSDSGGYSLSGTQCRNSDLVGTPRASFSNRAYTIAIVLSPFYSPCIARYRAYTPPKGAP